MKKFNEEIKILTTIFINNANINTKIKQEKFLIMSISSENLPKIFIKNILESYSVK